MDEFNQFWQNLWNEICEFFTNTEHGMSVVNKMLIALSILIVGFVLEKIIFSLLKKSFKIDDKNYKSPRKTVIRFVLNACKTVVVFFIILFALSTLGFKLDGLATIISSGILAIGVSLQDVIGNFASGIIILSSKLFVEGNYIEVNDNIKGTVKEIKMMTTIITTPENITITVPNNVITKGKVSNFNAETMRRIDLTIGVAYGTDLEAARKVLMNIILNDERILKDQPVTVAVKQLNASSIDLCVRGYTKNDDFWPTQFDLNQRIATELANRHINIPFNQLDVNLYNRNIQPMEKVDLTGVPEDVLDFVPEPHVVEEENDINKAIETARRIFKKRNKKPSKKEIKKQEEQELIDENKPVEIKPTDEEN